MSELNRLQGLLGLEPEGFRLQRIKALSDEDLLHAVRMLSDRSQIINVAALPALLAECEARGLARAKN